MRFQRALRPCLHALAFVAVSVLVTMSACSLGPAEVSEATAESSDELVKPLKPAWEAGRPICPSDLPQFCNIGLAVYDDAGVTGDRFICGDFEQGLCECMNQVRKDLKLGTDLKNYWVHTACVDEKGNRSREHATTIAKFPASCTGPGPCAGAGDAGDIGSGNVKLCLLEPQWSQPGTDPAYCCWTQASGSAIEIPESCQAKLCCPPLKTKVVSIGDNGDTPESCKKFYATDFNDDPGTVCNLNDAGVPCTCNQRTRCCGSTTTDGGAADGGGTTDGGTDGGGKDGGANDGGADSGGGTDSGAAARPCSAERSKWICRGRRECVWEGGECKSLSRPTTP